MENTKNTMTECMQTGKRVQILLSTYNGERYLREQLDSYLAMEGFSQCCVLIRDDGSTDGTQEILSEYAKRDDFKIVYGDNVGITDSYMWLLKHCNLGCEFFCLSDQDDVWLPQKVQKSLAALEQENAAVALLSASQTCITDAELNQVQLSENPVRGVSFYNAIAQNVLSGHTQMLNRTMVELLVERGCSDVNVIDWWIYLVAAGVGKIVFLPGYTVLHRQHGGNAVGMKTDVFSQTIKRLRSIWAGNGNALSKQLMSFYNRYRDILPDEYRREAERFLEGTKSLKTRISYVRNCRAYRHVKAEDFVFRALYVLGEYNI